MKNKRILVTGGVGFTGTNLVKPQMKFEDGLKKVLEWFAENNQNINRRAEF